MEFGHFELCHQQEKELPLFSQRDESSPPWRQTPLQRDRCRLLMRSDALFLLCFHLLWCFYNLFKLIPSWRKKKTLLIPSLVLQSLGIHIPVGFSRHCVCFILHIQVCQQSRCRARGASPLSANSCSCPPPHPKKKHRPPPPSFSEWTCCSLCPVTCVYSHTKPNPDLSCSPLSISCEV